MPDADGAERRARAVVEAALRGGRARRGSRGRAAPPRRARAAARRAGARAGRRGARRDAHAAGAAVAGWVQADARRRGGRAASGSALGPLPGGGRLLVTGAGGTWIVGRDGDARRAWAPTRRRHVVAARPVRRRVARAAAERGRTGRPRRVVATGRSAPSRDVRWSPDGYRIAYRSGAAPGGGRRRRQRRARARRDGARGRAGLAPDRGAHARVGPRDGRVVVRDVDSGRTIWRSPGGHGAARELLWSADGRRLLSLAGGRACACSTCAPGASGAIAVPPRPARGRGGLGSARAAGWRSSSATGAA